MASTVLWSMVFTVVWGEQRHPILGETQGGRWDRGVTGVGGSEYGSGETKSSWFSRPKRKKIEQKSKCNIKV